MKKCSLILIILIFTLTLSSCARVENFIDDLTSTPVTNGGSTMPASVKTKVEKNRALINRTNINNLIVNVSRVKDDASFIISMDTNYEVIDEDFIALFINGNYISNSNLDVDDDGVISLPIKTISQMLSMELSWDANNRKANLHDEENTVEVFIDEGSINLNASTIELSKKPEIINDIIYVPVEFLQKALSADVEYVEGKRGMVDRVNQLVISKYPAGATPLTAEEAMEVAKGQMVFAFERMYGNYKPYSEGETLNEEVRSAILRKRISELKITGENDRYLIINVGNELWVDKYTGQLYVYSNELAVSIREFNPFSDLAFAYIK